MFIGVISYLEYIFYLSTTIRLVFLFLFLILGILFIFLIASSYMFFDKLCYYIRNFIFAFKIFTFYNFYYFLNLLQLNKNLKTRNIEAKYFTNAPNSLKFKFLINKKVDFFILFFLTFLIFFYSFFYQRLVGGAYRIINYDKVFIKPDLLKYSLYPSILVVSEGENFSLHGTITGSYVPEYLTIKFNNLAYKLKIREKQFSFEFKNVTEDINFLIENTYLNHRKSYFIKCLKKFYFNNYFCVVNYPSYISKKIDTLYDINNITVPESSLLTFALHWNGKADLFVNDIKHYTQNNFYEYIFGPIFGDTTILFSLQNDSNHQETIRVNLRILPDNIPNIYLQHDKSFYLLSFTDDNGLVSGGYSILKMIGRKAHVLDKLSFSFYNNRNGTLQFELIDTIKNFDTIKLVVFARDNCPFRNQISSKSFVLATSLMNFQSLITMVDSTRKTFLNSLSDLNRIIDNTNEFLNQSTNSAESKYSKSLVYNELLRSIEKIKNQLNNLNINENTNQLSTLLDSLVNEIFKNNAYNNPSSYEKNKIIYKNIIDIAQLLKDKIEAELVKNDIQMLKNLSEEIFQQIKNNEDLINRITGSGLKDQYRTELNSLMNRNIKFQEFLKKLSENTKNYIYRSLNDTLSDINKLYNNSLEIYNQMNIMDNLLKINSKYKSSLNIYP